jgi:hypothetical protein
MRVYYDWKYRLLPLLGVFGTKRVTRLLAAVRIPQLPRTVTGCWRLVGQLELRRRGLGTWLVEWQPGVTD